jgi:hypothetical protein
MKLENIAAAYVAIVELEEKVRSQAPDLADDAGSLRTDLHALLMEALKERGIPFADRAEAARLAFQITRHSAVPA